MRSQKNFKDENSKYILNRYTCKIVIIVYNRIMRYRMVYRVAGYSIDGMMEFDAESDEKAVQEVHDNIFRSYGHSNFELKNKTRLI